MYRYPSAFMLAIFFIGCTENKTSSTKVSDIPSLVIQSDTLLKAYNKSSISVYQSDTALINHKKFVLSVYKSDISTFFTVEKQKGQFYTAVLVDSDYTTNNSGLFFNDQNKDGYLDIVWENKWQEHCYLFNPQKENFIEIGEFQNVDTLKIGGRPVLYEHQFPLLFLKNVAKEFGWMTELHSELFVINDSYQKISFATIDNFASLDDWNFKKCESLKSVVVNCYVPPYVGKYGSHSIWNSGKSVDSIFMKADAFDSSYIEGYWARSYKKLLNSGQVFQVRRITQLKYFSK